MEELRKENRRRLWNSLEMKDVKRNLLVVLIAFPLIGLIATARINDAEGKLAMSVIVAALMLPYLLFYLIRLVRILLQAEQYVFCRTTLTKPHTSLIHWLFYFSVVLKDENGKEFMADTHAIFQTRSIFGLQVEDYANRTVTVAHNPATGMVVVIG